MKVVKTGEKRQTLAELQAEHEKKPEDVEVAAKLAKRLVGREPGTARKLADAVLEKQKAHPLASVVIAKLDGKAGRTYEAIKTLEAAHTKDDPNYDLLWALSR